MNDKPTQPMTAEQVLKTLDHYADERGPDESAVELRQARTAVAEIIRRNGELEAANRRQQMDIERLTEANEQWVTFKEKYTISEIEKFMDDHGVCNVRILPDGTAQYRAALTGSDGRQQEKDRG